MKPKGLALIRILPTDDDDVVVMVLEDTSGRKTNLAIGPEGLNALLLPAIGLATRWAEKAELWPETLFGPLHALPATEVAFEPGRAPTEAAIRLRVGKVELSFLVSLDKLLAATAALAPLVAEGPSDDAH